MDLTIPVSNLFNQKSNNLMKIPDKIPQILLWDIRMFIESHDELLVDQMGEVFCKEFLGYKNTYGESKIQQLIENGSWRQARR
jgi:hypothetical protein